MSLHFQPDDLRILARMAIWARYQNVINSQKAVKKSRPVQEKTPRSRSSKEISVDTIGNPIRTAMILDAGIALCAFIKCPYLVAIGGGLTNIRLPIRHAGMRHDVWKYVNWGNPLNRRALATWGWSDKWTADCAVVVRNVRVCWPHALPHLFLADRALSARGWLTWSIRPRPAFGRG